jgi:hypothetical protein
MRHYSTGKGREGKKRKRERKDRDPQLFGLRQLSDTPWG